ncbi:hypothetical protein [Methylobacterium sp. sgz302541]|uniref:hypothetical protein n=1 Tax=unclassified Methylobacterium TaxID=2615210 RepID=UPI003D336E6E
MMPRKQACPAAAGLILATITLATITGLLPPALAQEAVPETPAAVSPAPEEVARPRPKPRPPARKPAARPPVAQPAEAPAESQGQAAPAPEGEGKTEPVPPAEKKPPARKPVQRAPKPIAKPADSSATDPKSAEIKPAEIKPAETKPAAAPPPALPSPTPAALAPPPAVPSEPPSACGSRAALFEGERGFSAHVTRLGRVSVENPLRPLTPEVTRVLQLTIGGKVATAYGPDLTALRRGGSPAVLEGQLGGGIRWEPELPLLPETLTIVSETGEPLARLGFRACTDAPAVKPVPEARAKDQAKERKAGARRAGEAPAPKTPPGFHLPQGAISQ